MAWYLAREYGDSVEVNYLDMSKPGVSNGFPEVVGKLKKGQIVLPAVYLDGEVVSQGYVDYFSIARALERARSNGNGRG